MGWIRFLIRKNRLCKDILLINQDSKRSTMNMRETALAAKIKFALCAIFKDEESNIRNPEIFEEHQFTQGSEKRFAFVEKIFVSVVVCDDADINIGILVRLTFDIGAAKKSRHDAVICLAGVYKPVDK